MTGYFLSLLEWACVPAIDPHLDWPAQRTVGTRIDASHCAATPLGFEVTARVKLVELDGRRQVFDVESATGEWSWN